MNPAVRTIGGPRIFMILSTPEHEHVLDLGQVEAPDAADEQVADSLAETSGLGHGRDQTAPDAAGVPAETLKDRLAPLDAERTVRYSLEHGGRTL